MENMDEDYKSARELLERLRKKYSGENTNDESNKSNKRKGTDKIQTQTLEDLKKKYCTENISGDNNIINIDTEDKPSTSQAQRKRQNKSKDYGPLNNNNKKETVTVIVDTNIINKYGSEITKKFEESEIFFKFTDQVCSGLVTWQRTPSKQDSNEKEDTKEAVLIINWEDVVSYIKSSSLLSYVKSLQELLPEKRLFLGLYHIDKYFKYWHFQRGGNMPKVDEKRLAEYKDSVKISRSDFEVALTEVQLSCNCCYRILNSPEDIVNLIVQFTKSIIQLPEKLEKRAKYKDYEWHMLKDNRDSVAVDKNGNGLQRLWQQQLTSFELARLETAEAVIAQYSTPSKLYEAYTLCSESEGQKLLEDIPIRRAAGPLTTSRKIGPELSSKIYKFFNSIDGDIVL